MSAGGRKDPERIPYPGFIGPTYQPGSRVLDSERCINLYPEIIESGQGKSRMALVGTPGLELFTTLPTSPCRGLWAGDNRLFAVGGATLYEVFANGSTTARGNVDTDAANSPVKIFSNGNQLLIISNGKAWIDTGTSIVQPTFAAISGTVDTSGVNVTWKTGDKFNQALVGATITINAVNYIVSTVALNGLSLVLTASAGTQTGVAYSASPIVRASSGAYMDGYFIVQPPNSNQINISALLDGTTWAGNDFAVRSGGQDRLLAVIADHEELWLIGKKTTEVWYNSGNAGFPFQRIQGAFIEQGCGAQFSPAKLDNRMLWLGGDDRGAGVVWMVQGYKPQRVSNHSVESFIQSYSKISDAVGYGQQWRGHSFYVLTFPTAQACWVYDLTTGMWHERNYWNGVSQVTPLGRFHAVTALDGITEEHFIGAGGTGQIYKQKSTVFTDVTQAIRRQRTAPHISDRQKWLYYHSLQIDMQVGVGVSVAGAELEVSNDGGFTFGTVKAASTGAAGQYKTRVKWRRLGRSRDRVFRVTLWDAIEYALVDAFVEVEPGTS